MLAVVNQPDPSFNESNAITDARDRARRLAISDLPILIEGEPGTGRRTLAASVIRLRSEQSGLPIVAVDAVDGLPTDFRPRFDSSDTSPLEVLVHNVESLSRREQAELASLVHGKRIRLVASSTHRTHDEGTGASTHYVPELDVEVGATRVLLPPLRERADDVARWAQFFLGRAAARLSLPVPILTEGAVSAVIRHRWPGNLIELDAAASRAVCLSASEAIEPTDLGLADGDTATIQPLADALEHFRKSYINRALAHFSGNRSQTARALGVDVRTIFRYLEKK